MELNDFLEGLLVAIDLPNISKIDPDLSFCKIEDFDSLATLGVMTFCEIEFNYQLEGQSLWDNQTTPNQLFDMVNK